MPGPPPYLLPHDFSRPIVSTDTVTVQFTDVGPSTLEAVFAIEKARVESLSRGWSSPHREPGPMAGPSAPWVGKGKKR